MIQRRNCEPASSASAEVAGGGCWREERGGGRRWGAIAAGQVVLWASVDTGVLGFRV